MSFKEKHRIFDKNVESIQVLKGIACLGIFLCHTGYSCFFGAGEWGTTIFLILSGFLLTCRYYGLNIFLGEWSLLDSIRYAWRKIKKLYPLHIVTMLALLLFAILGQVRQPAILILIKVLLNGLMINEWFPISASTFNNTSWYLSAIMVCYFLFPYNIRRQSKTFSGEKAFREIMLLWGCQIAIAILTAGVSLSYFDGIIEINGTWLSYYFPLSRVVDFIIGCDVGYLFLNDRNVINTISGRHNRMILIGVILMQVIANAINAFAKGMLYNGNDGLFMKAVVLICGVSLFTGGSCLMVLLFSCMDDQAQLRYTNKFLLTLGNVSMYFFLIHPVVFEYIAHIIWRLWGGEFYLRYGAFLKLTVGFCISFLLSKGWSMIMKRVYR